MKYAVYPLPILGPCPCSLCGESLYWARRNTRVENVTVGSLRWRGWDGRIHKCTSKPVAKRGPRRHHSLLQHEMAHPHGTDVRFPLASPTETSYDSAAGSSSQSDSMAHGARPSATTREAGAVAVVEVVAR